MFMFYDLSPVRAELALSMVLALMLTGVILLCYRRRWIAVDTAGGFGILAGLALGVGNVIVQTELVAGASIADTDPTVLVTKDRTQVKEVFPYPKQMWTFDPALAGHDLVPYKSNGAKSMTLHPITDNPKVRNLTYQVRVKKASLFDTSGRWEAVLLPFNLDVDTWLEYQLYEFNEMHSKKAARFYNPLDTKQQAEFASMVEEFLKPHLEAMGGSLVSVSFSSQ
jgi:hypothetical protein